MRQHDPTDRPILKILRQDARLELSVISRQVFRCPSYNVSALSISPAEVAAQIQKTYPGFKISFFPDFWQAVTGSWPASIDDRQARKDWGWRNNSILL